jgi:hypothetical protein
MRYLVPVWSESQLLLLLHCLVCVWNKLQLRRQWPRLCSRDYYFLVSYAYLRWRRRIYDMCIVRIVCILFLSLALPWSIKPTARRALIAITCLDLEGRRRVAFASFSVSEAGIFYFCFTRSQKWPNLRRCRFYIVYSFSTSPIFISRINW